MNQTKEQSTEAIAGILFSLLRASGVSMVPLTSHEKIRDVARRLVDAIEYRADKKAVESVEKLQTEVNKAFEAMEKDLANLQEQIKLLTSVVEDTPDETSS